MTKILLLIYAIATVFKFIVTAIIRLLRPKSKSQTTTTSVSNNWYGICEKCGTKGGLHRFEGKRYCAMCHARLSAEKKYGVKQNEHES